MDHERLKQIRKSLEKEFAKPIPEEVIAKFLPGIPYRRMGVIELTKLNGTQFYLNAELIETLESTPDTVLSLVTGRKYIVKESIEEVRDKFIRFKQEIWSESS